ncbi:hypothetical protein COX24_02950 [bacterium (Candidatus Gribaldobacteria) CG23_combo_of_CG06-09_8_20_14_all_37_87_8]|uniref:3D domain-containing protein n=2 Tax=Candidatus Gribaldobacteria TaxID=2798536 RepID=A0A2G9ZEI3_9BACT|nr:MAG: hypothetical protein AUJ25_02205 [Parcubacteria group bacterium CG1_02_37_13]PIP31567.1 MAG: hypothetical protein COX24_02950 [bacterium (Candidatus Gribaldobacteria) CG23_combo_of_CG06-09_8_20_14_all_37_87_8]PIR90625.1 MAG: hypothetical protein COU05_00995 [bacterium (Candidatus Gribaldobacteria) CG10_big_fil_rev_8_21_14_0_10_37_21]
MKKFHKAILFLLVSAEVIFVPGLNPEAETTPAIFSKAFFGFSFEKPKKLFVEKEVVATAYSPPLFPYKSPTFSGKPVSFGVVAVDPKVIPLGATVFLPQMFPGQKFLALDTGAKIKGNHIDVWLPTQEKALKWGRRKVKIRIIK